MLRTIFFAACVAVMTTTINAINLEGVDGGLLQQFAQNETAEGGKAKAKKVMGDGQIRKQKDESKKNEEEKYEDDEMYREVDLRQSYPQRTFPQIYGLQPLSSEDI